VDRRLVDPIRGDAATGIWGMGTGWEIGLFALDRYLRGEFDASTMDPGAAPPPEVVALVERSGQGWAELVAAQAAR